MANYKNAEKALMQSQRRRMYNKRNLSMMRTYIKKLRKKIESKAEGDELKELLKTTVAIIDRSVKKGVIKENTGNRYKSRLTIQVNKAISEGKK